MKRLLVAATIAATISAGGSAAAATGNGQHTDHGIPVYKRGHGACKKLERAIGQDSLTRIVFPAAEGSGHDYLVSDWHQGGTRSKRLYWVDCV